MAIGSTINNGSEMDRAYQSIAAIHAPLILTLISEKKTG